MLILLVVLAVAAVLFVAAVVATHEGDVLADAPPDRPDVDLPVGHVVAEDLRAVRFGMVFRGYRMSEVDAVLDRLGGELAERDERIADLERALVDVVEPAVQQAEARQAPPPVSASQPSAAEAPEPAGAPEVPEPALPPSLAPPLARGARDGEAPAEAPAPAHPAPHGAPEPAAVTAPASAEELTPVPEEWVAAASAAPAEPASTPPPSADPLDPAWEPSAGEPSTVERALDLAASYRFTMRGGGAPTVQPSGEQEPEEQPQPAAAEATSADAEPEAARTAVPEDELGFPEVEPAAPAAGWAPEAREDTGDEGREQRTTPEP